MDSGAESKQQQRASAVQLSEDRPACTPATAT
jgi:hypothetical protein